MITYSENKERLLKITEDETIIDMLPSVKIIDEEALYNSNVESITFSSSLETIKYRALGNTKIKNVSIYIF